MEKTKAEPYYKTRRNIENENFFERNRAAIWFWGIASGVVSIFVIPWVVGWYHIIF